MDKERMMATPTGFKPGSPKRAARDTVAEDLKERGVPKDTAFAEATSIVKRVQSKSALTRLMHHGIHHK